MDAGGPRRLGRRKVYLVISMSGYGVWGMTRSVEGWYEQFETMIIVAIKGH